jgi:hypothetical protein
MSQFPSADERGAPAETASPRRGRQAARRAPVDATRTWEAAEALERILEPGIELVHTKRLGWLLRRLDWVGSEGRPHMGWVEIDSAPNGQLGALLMRHQERTRTKGSPGRG